VVALIAGARAGVFATILGGIVGWLAFMTTSVYAGPTPTQGIGLALYAVSNGLIVWMAESYRGAIRRVEAQEAKRQLLLRELQHRSANTLASVQAIVTQTLRDNKEDARKINGRIAALAATNDLLTKSEDQTADLREIVLAELKPYGSMQVQLYGERTSLRPVLARAIGLVCMSSRRMRRSTARYRARKGGSPSPGPLPAGKSM